MDEETGICMRSVDMPRLVLSIGGRMWYSVAVKEYEERFLGMATHPGVTSRGN